MGALVCALALPQPADAAPPSSFRTDSEYLIDTWETDQGLPENSATAMAQDPDGYLWFGTFSGLVRFNGLSFAVFGPTNTPSLPSSKIVNLHLDRHGCLWVSTYGGLVVCEAGRWRRIEGLGDDYVRSFAERGNGDLLITTFTGKVLEFAGGSLSALPAPPGAPQQGYLGFSNTDGKWWVVQPRHYVGFWDGRWWQEAKGFSEMVPEVIGAGGAHDGGLWLLLRSELRKYRGAQEVARISMSRAAPEFWSLSEDGRGNVWICSYDSGLRRVDPAGGVRAWTTENGLAHNGVRFAFEDRERNLWVGTSGGGLTRFKPRRVQMIDSPQGLGERVTKSVSLDAAGRLWIATYGKGVYRTETAATAAAGAAGAARLIPVELPPTPAGSVPHYIESVFGDRRGRMWVGTFNDGVYVFEGASVRRLQLGAQAGNNVISLFEDSGGNIWIGGGDGVAEFRADGRMREFGTDQGLSKGGVRCFAEVRGVLWLTNQRGVFRLEGERFAEVREIGGRVLADIESLKADADGTIWMGTLSDGVVRWREGRVARIDARVGLPVQSAQTILEDDRGYFWLSSNRGIIRVSRKNLEAVADGASNRLYCQRLNLSDGMASVECAGGSQPSCARDSSGRLWFATVKGVASVDSGAFEVNSAPPTVRIEKFLYRPKAAETAGPRSPDGGPALGEVQLTSPFPARIVLPEGSRQIEIHYAALSFTAPEKVRFQTWLNGVGRDWEDVGEERVARFIELPAGEYSLRVRAANDDGVWNQDGTELVFSVRPYYWETAWFRAGTTLTLFGAGAGLAGWLAHSHHRRARLAMDRTRRQSDALVSLSLSPRASSGDVRGALREITEQAVRVTRAARVSVWLIDDRSKELYLADCFAREAGAHEEGKRVSLVDYDSYLQNLGLGRVIDSAGARDGSGAPPSNRAGLHAAVRLPGKVAGVVCLEPASRGCRLPDQELRFAEALASQVAQVLLNAQRERAASALRESEARFRSMANSAPVMIWMAGTDGGCSFFNEGWLKFTGRPMEQELGKGWTGGVHPEDLSHCLEVYEDALHSRQEFWIEYRLRHHDGEYRWVIDHGAPRFSADRTFLGYIGCAIDIDERRRTEAELQQERSELAHLSRVMVLGELSGSLAHELNQPLTAILSNAQAALRFLARGPADIDEVRSILSDIVEEDKRAGEVIHRLRQLLKKGEVQRQRLDLNEVVTDVLRLINSELMNHETSVSTELAADLPNIRGDRVQLQQVLLNLILNGCDAMQGMHASERQLVLRTAPANGRGVCVSVSDRGCGIPPDRLNRIFEPFYTTKSHGMGLGLAVCRTIVSAHAGSLSAVNNTGGRGATFDVVLPAAANGTPAIEASGGSP